jgi:tight adherence protein C
MTSFMRFFEDIKLLYQPESFVVAFVALAVFATIVTLALPLLQGNRLQSRMRAVASERAAMRKKERARMFEEPTRPSLRRSPKSFMRIIVERFNLQKLFDAEEMREKLRMAGLRGQAPLFTFLFFRLVMPVIVFLAALFYLFVVNDFGRPPLVRLLIAGGGGYLGFFLPNLFIANRIQKRQQLLSRAFPDALDLLLICVESGMSIEAAFAKVADEIGSQCIELAEELMLTTAELSYIQDRRQAYENFGKRTGLSGIKAVATTLIQAERYGTPLGQALRVMAQENRDMRMQAAEKKAAGLPPKLTVPMILFFLPVLFVVILGPAAIRMMETFK